MKFCETCQENFADSFSFCPLEGTALSVARTAAITRAPDSRVESQDLISHHELSDLLSRFKVPPVPQSLDERVWESYELQLKLAEAKANIGLRRSVALSLIGVF